MYYGKGTEEGVLANLYSALWPTGVAGIKFVDWQRIYDSGITPDRYPGVFINHIRTDKKRLLKNVVKNTMANALVCWVWAADNENLGTKLNAFITAVRNAVAADPTRGNNAYNTVIQSVTTDGGSRHPQGMGIISLVITYFSEK
jgi:hypothetical protein